MIFRNKFLLPENKIYFLGNSLGLQPKSTAVYIKHVLERWSTLGVESFFMGNDPWMNYHDHLASPMAKIVGAKPPEVVLMNSLTVNLHLLLTSFYRPTKHRCKIICEGNAFPSDQYMLETHLKSRGFDPQQSIIEIFPREGEYVIRTEDIQAKIIEHADELSLVLWSGVNYYSGQAYDIKTITQLAHSAGAIAGLDLAHAAGNVSLKLHEWNVDFACWCTYKYLNSGPGGIGGAYIHERYHNDETIPRAAGWWGYDKNTRFLMRKGFKAIDSAEGWQVSTPPILLMAALRASLEIFDEAGIDNLVQTGNQLSTTLIEAISNSIDENKIRILTPRHAKGCQVSLMVNDNSKRVFERLADNGIFADWREPDVIRVAPVPLYNTEEEIFSFVSILKKLIE